MLCITSRLFIIIAILCFGFASCGRSAADYVQRGDGHFERKAFADASLSYRAAIGKDNNLAIAYYKLGLSEIEQGKGIEAFQALNRAIQLNPQNTDALVKLGDLSFTAYTQAGASGTAFYKKADEIADNLLRNPKSFDGLRLKGYLASADRRLMEAARLLREADEVKPKQPNVLGPLVDVLFRNDQAGEAESLAVRVVGEGLGNTIVYNRLYGHYMNTKRIAEAQALLEDYAKQHPSETEPVLMLAAHFRRLNQPEQEAAAIQRLTAGSFRDGLLTAGDYYAATQNWTRAITAYRDGLNGKSAEPANYYQRIAAVHTAAGQRDQALAALDEGIRTLPGNANIRRQLAQLLAAGTPAELDRALAEYQRLEADSRGDASFQFEYGRAFLSKGNATSAKAHLSQSTRLQPGYLEPKLLLARIAQREGQFDTVLSIANEIMAQQPRHSGARFLRAAGLVGTGTYQQAKQELIQLQKEFPASVDVQLQLSLIEMVQKQYREAEERLRAAIRPGQRDLRPFLGLVQTYRLQRQPGLAVAMLEKELAKEPNDKDLRVLLASVLLSTGKFNEAQAQYQQLIDRNPKSAEIQALMGQSYQFKGETGKAIEYYRASVALNGEDPASAGALAHMLEVSGKKQEALEAYRKAIRLAPDQPILLNNLAYLLTENGSNLEEAEKLVQEALRKQPENMFFLDTLGTIYLKRKQFDAATQVFTRLKGKHPDDPTVLYHSASALIGKGEREKARLDLERALSKNPAADVASQIRELLRSIS